MLRWIVTLVWILVPAVYGGSEHGIEGFLMGGGAGAVLAGLFDARKRIASLERELAHLRELLSERLTPAAAAKPEAVAPLAEPVFPEGREAEPEPLQFEVEADSGVPGQAAEGSFTPVAASERREETGEGSGSPAGPAVPVARPWLVDAFLRFVTGGNLLVKTGLLVLFVGVSFLLKYASERNLLPIELRLAGAALGGIALLAVGWRLREKREQYALTLQGGGIGILYLVVFAGFRIYDLIPAGFAFAILLALCILSACLAVLQNAPSLAIFGAAGGFLAPVLTSTGRGSHVMLFSYYTLLDAGILGIAWFKAWRLLNLTGFAFTFGLGTLWGANYYTPEHFASTEPFLVIFFVFFTTIAVLFALRQPPKLKGYLDGTIVFGTPLIVFGQQMAMVRHHEFGAALSAVGMGVFYLGSAWAMFRWKPREMRLLSEAFLAISVGLVTIAIPLAFEYRGVSAAWALEGAALVWVGVRQERLSARVSGMLLQFGAGAALLPYILDFKTLPRGIPVLNGFFLCAVLVAFAGLFSSLYLSRNGERIRAWETSIAPLFGYWGLVWWYGAGLYEIDRYAGHSVQMGASEAFIALSCAAAEYFRTRLDWALLRYPALGLLPAMFFLLLFSDRHPFAQGGIVGWPVALAAHYWILHENEDLEERRLGFLHAGTVWLLAPLLVWEFRWQATDWTGGRGSWHELAGAVSLSGLLLLGAAYGHRVAWPIDRHYREYVWIGLAPVAVAGWAWALATGLSSEGDPWPLSYLPFANALDLAIACVFLTLVYWLIRLRQPRIALPEALLEKMPQVLSGVGISIFFWLNSTLIRCIHYWVGVPLSSHALMHSFLVQASLSIFWTITSFCLMVFSTRRHRRVLWFLGAALLAVVVVKLFLIDLAGSGTIERIVSFVAVGVLILIVGYLSPVPPQKKGTENVQ